MNDPIQTPLIAQQIPSHLWTKKTRKGWFLLALMVMLTLSCGLPFTLRQAPEPPDTPDSTTTPTLVPDTATPAPTDTEVPAPPTETPTPTPLPVTATPTISPWVIMSGTWSGCLEDASPSSNTVLEPCSNPTGEFITLYLTPTCLIGNVCGTYVKGTFESEAITFKLDFLGLQGPVIYMYADAGSGMFSWASTNIDLEMAGANLALREAAGEGYTLLRGCDPVIAQNVIGGCKH